MADEKGGESAEQFSEEDLSHIAGGGADGGEKDGAGAEGAEAGKVAADGTGKAGDDGKAAAGAVDGNKGKTIASGAEVSAEDAAKQAAADKAHKPYWPDDWREKLAEHASAGDKKLYTKELTRLKRIADPFGVYGMARELEGKLTSGGLVKIPAKDAKPEEVSAFAKALGWTEKPEELLGQIKLESGAVLGDADKPVLTGFLQAVHGATTAQEFTNKATNWYFKQQEDAAAAQDEADDTFRREAETTLKEEFGPAFKRKTNAIATLFALAPGGSDAQNASSVYARLLGGRTADGRIIGNDPDIVRFLSSLALEVNPAATVVEDGNQSGQSLNDEIAKIEGIMRENRREYNEKHATRYGELLAAREKIQSRQRA